MKVCSRANFSSNIFRLIQHIFHVESVYSFFIQYFILMTSFRVLELRISNDSTKLLTIYLNHKNNMGQNAKIQRKKLKIAEKEKASRPKKVCKGNRRLRKLRNTGKSTSSDSVSGKSISVVIFDLISNERMNGLGCWMKHVR